MVAARRDPVRRRRRCGLVTLTAVAAVLTPTSGALAEQWRQTTRVSVGLDRAVADGDSWGPSLAGDGRLVAFTSEATNLVPGDGNGVADVFVRDPVAGVTTRVSVATAGTEADGPSARALLTGDGRYVVFTSSATNLVPDDTNGVADVFRHDRSTGTTERVSLATDGGQATSDVTGTAVSDDGRLVLLTSTDEALGATLPPPDAADGDPRVAHVRDVAGGSTTLLDAEGGFDGALSGDGTLASVLRAERSDGDACCPTLRSHLVTVADGAVVDDLGRCVDAALSRDGATVACTLLGDTTVTTLVRSPAAVVQLGVGARPPARFGPLDTVDQPVVAADGGAVVVRATTHRTADGMAWLVPAGTDTLLAAAGAGLVRPLGAITDLELSPDGGTTAYASAATNLDARSTGARRHVWVTSWPRGDQPLADAYADDDGSLFEDDVDWLAAAGITAGCRGGTSYCAEDPVTRGELAALLARALRLPPSPSPSRFVDVDDSIFARQAEALAAAGITRGCNPPRDDRFCPSRTVTRGQVAAFLHRVAGPLQRGDRVGTADTFRDDDGSVFEADIEAVVLLGTTRGCNPPANDRFCPQRAVTRGELAALLHRFLAA